MTSDEEFVGGALLDVWNEGKGNHAEYSTMDTAEADIQFLALALCGEAGELANFVKKEWRDGKDYRFEQQLEVADVCLYAFMLADKLGLTPLSLIQTMAAKQTAFREKMKALRSERDGE